MRTFAFRKTEHVLRGVNIMYNFHVNTSVRGDERKKNWIYFSKT